MQRRRPTVTLTYAQSIDGSITHKRGESLTLSGRESLIMTHQLRAEHDAILIGVGTVLADNPSLTVRLVAGQNPQPIIVDSQLRCPINSKLAQSGAWIATTVSANPDRKAALEATGARVVCLPNTANGLVSLADLLTWLEAQGVASLMVEGGAQVIQSFLNAQLVDKVIITVAPKFLGGLNAVAQLHAPLELHEMQIKQVGEDIVVSGVLA